jgi:diguanylate cyclase (GGDEF)-like protein/PAS domain S-box-containing protein
MHSSGGATAVEALTHLELAHAAPDWPVGVILASGQGGQVRANPAAVELLARLGASVAPDDLFATFADCAPGLRLSAARLSAPGQNLRRRLRGQDGAVVALTLIRAGDGGFNVLLDDETALARAEDEAHRQRARCAALADHACGGAVFTLDAEGRIASWSRSAEQYEGLSAGEALGLSLHTLLERSHFAADARALLGEAARSADSVAAGWRLAAGGNPAWATLTLRAVRAADGSLDGFVAIARDAAPSSGREAELRRLAETDSLTGMLNRRAFFATARAALHCMRKQAATMAVVAFDIDEFKALNDTYGHGAGDAALRALADAALGDVRRGDLTGRLGGDEFAIALPRTDLARATAIAERLRARIEALRITHRGATLRLTASFGVATQSTRREPFEETLARADEALYRAKAEGRNRVARA